MPVTLRYEQRFPELKYLLAAYFHEDWLHEYDWAGSEPSYEAIVRQFKAKNPRATVEQATRELAEFIKLPLPDKELKEVVAYDLGCAYYPPGSGQTYREWLEAVLVVLHEPTASSYLKPREQPVQDGWKEYVDEETKRMLSIK